MPNLCFTNKVVHGTLDESSDYPSTHEIVKRICDSESCGDPLGYNTDLTCVEVGPNKWEIYHSKCCSLR